MSTNDTGSSDVPASEGVSPSKEQKEQQGSDVSSSQSTPSVDDKGGTPLERRSSKSDSSGQQPIQTSPIPPADSGQQVQVALGMQLIRQSAFDNLPAEVQSQLIQLAADMDRHAFENAQESLKGRTELQKQAIADNATGRRQILITLGSLALLSLAAGTTITILLILNGEHQLGHTVMMSGLAVITALLGGAGVTTLLKNFNSSR